MELLQIIESDYQKAFRGAEVAVRDVLRVLKSALQNEEIAKRGKIGDREAKLTDEEALATIKRQVKQLEEARDLFKQGGRADLVAQNEAELVILKKYLPMQASAEEVRAAVKKVLAGMPGAGVSDFGKIMGATIKALGGKADGTLASKMVKELLGGK